MAVKGKRVVRAQLVTRGSPEEQAFDQQFWRECGPEARFAAMWEMVGEAQRMRGGDGTQPRLQRSVQRVLRRMR